MSQSDDGFNVFDPTGMMKGFRDASMESWSKMMIQLVNTEAYAKSTGAFLDAWLSSSMPFRKAMETVLTQVVTNLQMPTRGDVTSLAERLTHIEIRLDDMEAKLDEIHRAGRKSTGKAKTDSHSGEPKS